MDTGTYGQQAIDTVKAIHLWLLAGFGTMYVVALLLTAFACLLWIAREAQGLRQVRARRKVAAARAKRRKPGPRPVKAA